MLRRKFCCKENIYEEIFCADHQLCKNVESKEWENMQWSHCVNSSKFHLLRARSNGCSNQIVSENFVIFAYFNWTMIVFDGKPMKIAYFKQNTAIQYMHAAQMTLYLHLNDKQRKVLQLFFCYLFSQLTRNIYWFISKLTAEKKCMVEESQ